MQAATFDADIADIAKLLSAELTIASEDTGPIKVIYLSSQSGQFAMLVSHECGDPLSIEVRLHARPGPTDWVISREELEGTLASLGLASQECTWICPLVAP